MNKRIILLLDGTWNDDDVDGRVTNIVRMRDLIAKYLQLSTENTRINESNNFNSSYGSKIESGFTASGLENKVFYQRGVGTGFLDNIRGGAFGMGLPDNIRRAYKYLSFFYEPGDQIFIFGFSRGAFTARSLVGYIAASGLLKKEFCTKENEKLAWYYYRELQADRMPGIYAQLEPFVHNRERLRISCVGVFDTVGALGIPSTLMRKWNRDRYEFHNVDLSSITLLNLQAIALDEHRQPFEASVWRRPKFTRYSSVTEQVWFSGSHSDIGGGYIDDDSVNEKNNKRLDDISLDWMIKRVKSYFPDFPCSSVCSDELDSSWVEAQQHNSRKGIYYLYRSALRSISNQKIPHNPWLYECCVSRDRHYLSIGEMVHISAIERVGTFVREDYEIKKYKPRNLISILSYIYDTYRVEKSINDLVIIKVVKWNGEVFDPSNGSDRYDVQKAVSDACLRIGNHDIQVVEPLGDTK